MDDYGLTLVAGPTQEPVSLGEAKAWLRIDHAADDAVVDSLVATARMLAEKQYGRQLVTATWKITLSGFPCRELRVPRGPLQSVASVQYIDSNGDLQTLDADLYEADETREPGVIQPAYGQVWPVARCQAKSVRVTYVAGYGLAVDVPEPIKAAIKFAAACWYQRRGDGDAEIDPAKLSLPTASQHMLMAYWDGSYA